MIAEQKQYIARLEKNLKQHYPTKADKQLAEYHARKQTITREKKKLKQMEKENV